MVQKGTISALYESGKKATVKPYMGEIVTVRLVVPFFLYKCLAVGMPVVYATFEDNTGVILARMDGEWNHRLEGDVRVIDSVYADDFVTDSAGSYESHTHVCPDGATTEPTPDPVVLPDLPI